MFQMYFGRFLVVLAIVADHCASALQRQICVRELEYSHNGRCCDLCPPGYYKVKDCTRDHSTECARCENGYYLEHPNFVSRCRRCTRCSSKAHKEEMTPCLKDQDRVCQCIQGYYNPPGWVLEVCIRHMKCPPGEGVDRMGTRLSNTVCRPCAHGTFSNKRSSRQKCRQWTDCEQQGREELEFGTQAHDAVCGTKLTVTTQTVPPLKSTVKSKSTTMAASTTAPSRSKPQPLYSVFSPKPTISMPTTSSRSSRQQSDSAPLPNFTMVSTTPTPSNQQSTSDFTFVLMSSTASSTQSVSEMSKSPPKHTSTVHFDIKTLLTKAKTAKPSPSSDQGISDFYNSSTHSPGSTTTAPMSVASANGGTKADQRSTTSPSPAVTIMQPKTIASVSYFIEVVVKAKPATTPATYTGTAKQKKETNNGPDVRNNGVHGQALQRAMIVILSCLLIIAVVILAAIVIKFWCQKKTISLPTDVPVYYNRRQGVTIGAASQGADGIGGSGSPDNGSDAAVCSVEVHGEANQINIENERSPLIPAASGEHPEEAASPSEVPDIPITEAILAKLAKTIGPGWENAGLQVLGITRAQLDTCKTNNQNNRDMQIFDMLNLWKQNKGKGATLRTLCQLLTKAGVEYTVEE